LFQNVRKPLRFSTLLVGDSSKQLARIIHEGS